MGLTSRLNPVVLPWGALLVGLLVSCHPRNEAERQPWGPLEPLVSRPSQPPDPERSYPRYRYSVVPGGVHDFLELARATGYDRVVRDHYGDANLGAIDLQAVRFTRLKRDRDAYVSYRVGDNIYWTRHRVHLPRGEQILTDGRNEARARCGNRISETPREPTEPPVEARNINEFEVPRIEPPLQPILLYPPTVAYTDPTRAADVGSKTTLVSVVRHLWFPAPPSLGPVPEPGTIVLCLSGIVFAFLKSLVARRREDRARVVARTAASRRIPIK